MVRVEGGYVSKGDEYVRNRGVGVDGGMAARHVHNKMQALFIDLL